MGASTVSSGWSNHFIELLDVLHVKMPLWLAYDHWTGIRTAQDAVAHQMALTQNPGIVPGSQAFIQAVDAIKTAQPTELVQRAHDLLAAPSIFGVEIGFNLPAFVIALIITWILVVGIKESARFNATIVAIKLSVVLFVIIVGIKYVNFSNWGSDWHSFAPYGFSGIGAGAAYIFFAYIGFDAVSTTAQEAKKPQRDLPIGIIVSLVVCTILYIAVAGILTGMVPWREVNIEAPIARAFLDRNLVWASYLITAGDPRPGSPAREPEAWQRTPAASSSPCSATFSRQGEIGPPRGVPSPVGANPLPASNTPAFSQPRIRSLAGNDPRAARR